MPVISPPNNTEPRGPTHLNMIEMAAPSINYNFTPDPSILFKKRKLRA